MRKLLRFILARAFVLAAIAVMPDGRFKQQLRDLLWSWSFEMAAVASANKCNVKLTVDQIAFLHEVANEVRSNGNR